MCQTTKKDEKNKNATAVIKKQWTCFLGKYVWVLKIITAWRYVDIPLILPLTVLPKIIANNSIAQKQSLKPEYNSF